MNLNYEKALPLAVERDGLSQGLAAIASVMAFGREISVSWEAAALMRSKVFAGIGVPHGHGEKILVIPGVMAGDASLPFMPDAARVLSQAIPQGQLRMLEGQTHEVNPAVLAPVLVEFLTS